MLNYVACVIDLQVLVPRHFRQRKVTKNRMVSVWMKRLRVLVEYMKRQQGEHGGRGVGEARDDYPEGE